MSLSLNQPQRSAVRQTDLPLLVLAGAGSGKTGVITHKIAWLLEDLAVPARNVFAVTFTNKAAREMKERVGKIANKDLTKGLTVSTFHSLGMQILRTEIEAAGLHKGFSIFDGSDCEMTIKEIMRSRDGEDSDLADRIRYQISDWKNQLISPEIASQTNNTDPSFQMAARGYPAYNRQLRACNAVDLDDLISLPVFLLRNNPNILEKWQNRVRHMLVDEYQDTNNAQYEMVRLLVGKHLGLTVVGDDDQSIYAWRGANPENLNQLQSDYPDMQLVKLEQNYRSMGRILEVANHLISNNPRPFEKTLWSELGFGDPINVLVGENETREAEKVVAAIMQHHFKHQTRYSDYAILYRGNHQSRVFEEKLREMRIPYHISGGISFFERSEIKDLMAYLRILINDKDDNAFVRAINSPRRGFGAGGMEKLGLFAGEQKSSLLVAAQHPGISSALSSRQYAPLSSFVNQLDNWREAASNQSANHTLHQIIDDIDFRNWIDSNSKSVEQSDARWRNVEELLDWMHRLGKNSEGIEEVVNKMSLMDILSRDDEDEDADRVSLMTMHAAKGLEFPVVFIVGVEEELLPHRNSIQQGTLEEERRLFYVGITRARRELSLSFARKRSRFGEIIDCNPSRFFDELPDHHLRWDNVEKPSDEDKQSVARAHLAAMRAALSG